MVDRLCAVFVGLEFRVRGAEELSFRFALIVAIISVAILVLFGVLAFTCRGGRFRQAARHRPNPDAAGSKFIPAVRFRRARCPSPCGFFLGIEGCR